MAGLPQFGCGDDDPSVTTDPDTGEADESRERDLGNADTGDEDSTTEDTVTGEDTVSNDMAPDNTTEDVADTSEDVAEETVEDMAEETVEDAAEETEEDTSVSCNEPLVGDLLINEVLAAPASGAAGDSNCDGTRNGVDDEFIELVNNTSSCLNLANVTINKTGAVPLNHAFPDGTVVEANGAIVVFGGPPGGAAVFDGTSTSSEPHCVDLSGCSVPMQLASQGALAFPNAEDTITIKLGATIIDTYSYGGDSGNTPTDGESMVRNPDVEHSFVTHTSINAGLRQSPGTQTNGTAFVELGGCDP